MDFRRLKMQKSITKSLKNSINLLKEEFYPVLANEK